MPNLNTADSVIEQEWAKWRLQATQVMLGHLHRTGCRSRFYEVPHDLLQYILDLMRPPMPQSFIDLKALVKCFPNPRLQAHLSSVLGKMYCCNQ